VELSRSPIARPAEVGRRVGAHAKRTVLIADDDPAFRTLLALQLAWFDGEVLEARDGNEAIRVSLERVPDLLILDVVMPGPSGYEVTREVRRLLPGHVRVLLITGSVRSGDRAEAFAAGANAYLKKPFTAEELREQVESLLAALPEPG
jgi:two-component system phosphate regulon response regulator PhoB